MRDSESIPLPGALAEPNQKVAKASIEWFKVTDGVQVGCRVWHGHPGSPVVIYLHGIEGHSQWFERTASVLNQKGVTVYAVDRRGSGVNSRERGHLNSHKIYLSDIELLLSRITNQNPGCPIVLMANCWSAKAAAIIARQDYRPTKGNPPVGLAGLILTCPAIYTKVDVSLATKLRIAWDLLQASDRLLKYWPLPLTPLMYTNNPEYLEFLERDPLRLKQVTTAFLIQTAILSWRAKRANKSINLPLLIIQSGADQIVEVERTEQWFGEIASKDKTMRIFPDAFHSIDFDQTWFKEYTHLLNEWLSARSPVSV